MISDTLARHGIGKQVKSAMIVREGNNALHKLINAEYLGDVRVLSFHNNTLTIVCRHSSSAHMINSMRIQIKEYIEVNIPDATINNVQIVINPHSLDSTADFSDIIV